MQSNLQREWGWRYEGCSIIFEPRPLFAYKYEWWLLFRIVTHLRGSYSEFHHFILKTEGMRYTFSKQPLPAEWCPWKSVSVVPNSDAWYSHVFLYIFMSLHSIQEWFILYGFCFLKSFWVINRVLRQHFCWRTPLWGKYFRNEAPNSYGITESLIYSIEHDKETYVDI